MRLGQARKKPMREGATAEDLSSERREFLALNDTEIWPAW